jgi:hypothetical protein
MAQRSTATKKPPRPRSAFERAMEPRDVLEALQAYGLTQTEIARATGVPARAVRKWPAVSLRPKTRDRLQDLRALVLRLEDGLTPRGVGEWLHARHRLLGWPRAIDVLAEGDTDQVEQAAAYLAGDFI